MFSNLTWKKIFLFQEMEGGWRTRTPTPLLGPKTAVYTLIYRLRNSTFTFYYYVMTIPSMKLTLSW